MASDEEVIVYTDGACKHNPGPGGYAAIVRRGEREQELVGWDPSTTNNRMELMAVIVALEDIDAAARVVIHSDSRYVIDGITKWIVGWQKRNWKKVKNVELWRRLLTATEDRRIEWKWVPAHAGIPGNERADTLASEAAIRQGLPWE